MLRNLHLRLDVDDRIGLVGVNGAGKTMFAKLLAGALPLQSGRMVRENRIKVGWFHQQPAREDRYAAKKAAKLKRRKGRR